MRQIGDIDQPNRAQDEFLALHDVVAHRNAVAGRAAARQRLHARYDHGTTTVQAAAGARDEKGERTPNARAANFGTARTGSEIASSLANDARPFSRSGQRHAEGPHHSDKRKRDQRDRQLRRRMPQHVAPFVADRSFGRRTIEPGGDQNIGERCRPRDRGDRPPPRVRRRSLRHCARSKRAVMPSLATEARASRRASRTGRAARSTRPPDANVVQPAVVVRQPGTIGSRMPQMQHAGREYAVLAASRRHAAAAPAGRNPPGPSPHRRSRSRRRDRDRCARPRDCRSARRARRASAACASGPSGRRISGTVRLMPPRPRSRAHSR